MGKYNVIYISSDVSLGGSAQSLVDMLSEIKQYINPIVIIPDHGILEETLLGLDIKYYVVSFPFGAGKADITKNQEDAIYKQDYEAALKLVPIIENENIQIIHTNSSVTNMGAIAAAISNKPHVWHIRELLEEHLFYKYTNEDIKKELLKGTDIIISISNCVSQKYCDKYGIDTTMIYDGMNLKRFILPLENEKKNKNTFLLAGAINEGKGQTDAINAVDFLVHEKKENIQLVIIGDGDDKYVWFLKKYIEKKGLTDYIHMYPFQKDLGFFRKQCEFAIVASRCEALGRVTIEAMLAGNIAIGANAGGTIEVIGKNQERGFLYQQGDYLDLAKVMLDAMNLANDEKIMIRSNAQKYAVDEFDVKEYALKILEIYKSVLNDKKSNPKANVPLLKKLEERFLTITDEKVIADKANTLERKFWRMFLQNNRWLHIRQMGHSIGEILLRDNINTVAIYGMGYLGRSLYDELESDGVHISYVMDRQAEEIGEIIKVRTLEDELEKVDAIIVTVIEGENIIINALKNTCDYRIIGLSELFNLFEI